MSHERKPKLDPAEEALRRWLEGRPFLVVYPVALAWWAVGAPILGTLRGIRGVLRRRKRNGPKR